MSPSDTFPLLQRSRCFPHLGLFTARWWQTFTIKTSVRAIVYFSQKMVHMSASLWNRGRSTFASAILRQTHHQLCSPPISLFPSPSLVFTFPLLKREMRGGSQDNWPCVSWAVWSRNAVEATHLRAAQQTVKCSTGGRTWLQRERGTRAV